VLRSLPRASIVLLIPIILDVGILSGVFTPAESGAVAIVVTMVLLALSARRDLRTLGRGFEAAVNNTSTVMFILISVSIINYGFSVSNVGTTLDSWLGSVTNHPLLLLLVINLIFAVVHEFVDAGPTILVLVPLILPAVTLAHVSLLQLAAVIAINSTIGAILPPVGVSLYVSAGIAGVSPGRLMRPIVSYVLSSVVVLVLVTVIPSLSTWLPGVMK
jgi:C4-dicarboxylate transporter DctM subunit